MARHLAAYYSSVNLAALTAFAAVPDQQLFTEGNAIRVDPTVDMIGSSTTIYLGTAVKQTQLNSPSLRQLAPYDSAGQNLTFPTTVPLSTNDLYDAPLQLAGNESLTFSVDGTAGGAVNGYGIVEFLDGPVKPVTGTMFTVRATGAATLEDGEFVNTPVTFDTQLPAGSYNIAGFRAEGAHLYAARIACVGAFYRPGVLGTQNSSVKSFDRYRMGRCGSFGTFNINQPPTVDCLGNTDSTQVFYFDLMMQPNS